MMPRYAKSSGIDSGKPYTVWNAPGAKSWWTVLDCQGKNVLRDLDNPGAVFTAKEDAVRVCDKWNK